MNENSKLEFEEKFNSAVTAGLKKSVVSDALRSKILSRLEGESKIALPEGVTEQSSLDFQERLSVAVHKSQDWAPEDVVILRAESRLSGELKKNILSERSVGALAAGHEAPPSLSSAPVPEEKLRFVQTLRDEIKRTTAELKASEEVRAQIKTRLDEENTQTSKNDKKVLAFPTRTQWKRGISALGSLAAGFAIMFVTLFGSADVAMANSIQTDHQTCCQSIKIHNKEQSVKYIQSDVPSEFANAPAPPVDSSWELQFSEVCESEKGETMIHHIYSRPGDEENAVETLSFHFFPELAAERGNFRLEQDKTKDISSDDFAVIAWLEGDWVCTASSSELDSESLANELPTPSN